MNATHTYVVPVEYHCDNHVPGTTMHVCIVSTDTGTPGWVYVQNVDDLDEFPAALDELTELP